MNFATREFIFFLFSVFPLWWIVRKNYKTSILVLFVSSAIFYGLHKPALLLFLGMYCIWGWVIGLGIGRNIDKNLKRPAFLWLVMGVMGNLLGLCFFKYTPLVVNTLVRVAWELEWSFRWKQSEAGVFQWEFPFSLSLPLRIWPTCTVARHRQSLTLFDSHYTVVFSQTRGRPYLAAVRVPKQTPARQVTETC